MPTKRGFRALLPLAALLCAGPAAALHESAPAAPVAQLGTGPVFILDPGHGGDDNGAVVSGRVEKDLALVIARKVQTRLAELGVAGARLTRESDVHLPLDKRVEASMEWAGNIFVSLHLNKVRYKQRRGIMVFAYGKARFKAPPSRNARVAPPLAAPPAALAHESFSLASSLVASLRAQGFRVDDATKAGFYVLKNPSLPSVLIELGYLSNPQEGAKLADPAYQDRLAEAVALSLRSYAEGPSYASHRAGAADVASSGR
jgi:N-acetylmuramoyl-L-alanine amidase